MFANLWLDWTKKYKNFKTVFSWQDKTIQLSFSEKESFSIDLASNEANTVIFKCSNLVFSWKCVVCLKHIHLRPTSAWSLSDFCLISSSTNHVTSLTLVLDSPSRLKAQCYDGHRQTTNACRMNMIMFSLQIRDNSKLPMTDCSSCHSWINWWLIQRWKREKWSINMPRFSRG